MSNNEDDLATGIATGALPPPHPHVQSGVPDLRLNGASIGLSPGVLHDRSRAIVPKWLSNNKDFQFCTQFFGAGMASELHALC